jgi:FixJ family two-component response regulator
LASRALLLFRNLQAAVAEEARKIAVSEAELQRRELTHMMRVAALGELSGGIAHELSQPLTAILFNAQAAQELVDKNGDREAIAEILEDIVQDDRRAGEVIQHLRQLMKKGAPETTLINLNDKITSTLGLLHSELVDRRIKVQTDLRTDVPPVSGDRVQLQQVFLNLMMNAMDAMASTPPSDRILSIATRTTEEGYVEVSIRDGGPGMSAETLKRVFEPFFTTKERGLGLGLSICSTILTSHRGRPVYRTPWRGYNRGRFAAIGASASRGVVIAKVYPLPRAVPEDPVQDTDATGYVAIVDDDSSVRRAQARLLGACSFCVQTYQSGREFLDSLNSSVPACLIVDLQMADMTGLELLQHLAGMGLRIPSIVVTARDESDIRHRCELSGAVAFLLKPVMKDPLLKAIKAAIGIRVARPWRTVVTRCTEASRTTSLRLGSLSSTKSDQYGNVRAKLGGPRATMQTDA